MRMKGKKPIFNYKDTYDLSEVLKPIIGEGIKKFLEVKADKGEWFGVPGVFMQDVGETDVDKASVLWDEVLDKMDYAFNAKAPDMLDYKFGIELVTDDLGYSSTVVTGRQSEYERFKEDEKIHHFNVEEGCELFGKYFNCLWW